MHLNAIPQIKASWVFRQPFSWQKCPNPILFNGFSYGFPMVFPWNHHFPMVLQWFSNSSTIFLWFSYGFPMVFLGLCWSSPPEARQVRGQGLGLVQDELPLGPVLLTPNRCVANVAWMGKTWKNHRKTIGICRFSLGKPLENHWRTIGKPTCRIWGEG